jgi:hypothetical protein
VVDARLGNFLAVDWTIASIGDSGFPLMAINALALIAVGDQ